MTTKLILNYAIDFKIKVSIQVQLFDDVGVLLRIGNKERDERVCKNIHIKILRYSLKFRPELPEEGSRVSVGKQKKLHRCTLVMYRYIHNYFINQLKKKCRIAGTYSVREVGYYTLVHFFTFPALVHSLSQLSK